MRLTRDLINDIFDNAPVVRGRAEWTSGHRHLFMDQDATAHLSGTLKRYIRRVQVVPLSVYPFSKAENPALAEDLRSYQKKIENVEKEEISVLVLGKRPSKSQGYIAYGYVVPETVDAERPRWPYFGTSLSLLNLFSSAPDLTPVHDQNEIDRALNRKIDESEIYFGSTLEFLMGIARKVSDGTAKISGIFRPPLYFRYERALVRAYKFTLRHNSTSAMKTEAIVATPIRRARGYIGRSPKGVLTFLPHRTATVEISYTVLPSSIQVAIS